MGIHGFVRDYHMRTIARRRAFDSFVVISMFKSLESIIYDFEYVVQLHTKYQNLSTKIPQCIQNRKKICLNVNELYQEAKIIVQLKLAKNLKFIRFL